MNWYWLIAGGIILFTGFIHAILGEKWIFSKLHTDNLNTHYTGEVTKNTLRWFWHFGSFMIFGVGSLALTMALSDNIIPAEQFIGKLLAGIYFGLIALLILCNISDLRNLKEYPQGLIIFGVGVLLWLGAS